MKKIVYSGLQPTGTLHIGNYFGAVKNMCSLQDEYYCFYNIANLHSTTVAYEPQLLKDRSIELAAMLMACGIDPKKSVLFLQSDVDSHAALMWALSCYTYIGEAQRMTQFKDKSKRGENVSVALLNYPILQAADILLYNTSLVPIGKDQKQHLELTRLLAGRFNSKHGETFIVPEILLPKYTANIMSLADPTKKMSKSDQTANATVLLTDSNDVILNKFKRAVTDSDNRIIVHKDKAGISNLLSIYATAKQITVKQAETEFDGAGYGKFKQSVADAVIAVVEPIRERYFNLCSDKQYILSVLNDNAQIARAAAQKTVSTVYSKMGYFLN